jgi:hypothetical protein
MFPAGEKATTPIAFYAAVTCDKNNMLFYCVLRPMVTSIWITKVMIAAPHRILRMLIGIMYGAITASSWVPVFPAAKALPPAMPAPIIKITIMVIVVTQVQNIQLIRRGAAIGLLVNTGTI